MSFEIHVSKTFQECLFVMVSKKYVHSGQLAWNQHWLNERWGQCNALSSLFGVGLMLATCWLRTVPFPCSHHFWFANSVLFVVFIYLFFWCRVDVNLITGWLQIETGIPQSKRLNGNMKNSINAIYCSQRTEHVSCKKGSPAKKCAQKQINFGNLVDSFKKMMFMFLIAFKPAYTTSNQHGIKTKPRPFKSCPKYSKNRFQQPKPKSK